MPANNSRALVHYWAGKYPGALGHLYSPGSQRGPYPWLSYALDNGAFVAYTKQQEWDEDAFSRLLEWASKAAAPPEWVLCPDVVANREATLERWGEWEKALRSYGWPVAFAVQDGMTAADVPASADVVFVGGTTRWKRRTLWTWAAKFPRVHVGRINTNRWLWVCAEAGVESCDGTGWFRGDKKQLDGLEMFLRDYTNGRRRNPSRPIGLFDGASAI